MDKYQCGDSRISEYLEIITVNKLFIIILVVLLCSVALLFFVAASDPEWIQVDAKSKNSSVHSYLPSSLKGSKRIRYLWLNVIYNDESLGKVFDYKIVSMACPFGFSFKKTAALYNYYFISSIQ